MAGGCRNKGALREFQHGYEKATKKEFPSWLPVIYWLIFSEFYLRFM